LVGIDKKGLETVPENGDFVFTQVATKPLQSRINPGGFDYKAYLKKIKVCDQINLSSEEIVIHKNNNKINPLSFLRSVNGKIEKKLDHSPLSTASKNLIKTLILGKRNALDQELIQAYANAGVIDILAISGLHMGIIMLFLGYALKPIKWITKSNGTYLLFIIASLWSFAVFTGNSPSVTRAVTMFTGFAIGKYSHRIHNTFHLLVVSFFLLLVIYPPFLFKVGFQMSYLAVLGIIKINPLIQQLWRPRFFVLRRFWEITCVCLAAQIAVAPLSIFYFHQFPGLFLLSNWLVIPLFGLFLIVSLLLVVLIGLKIEIGLISVGYDSIVYMMNEAVLWIANQEHFLFQNMRLSLISLVTIYTLMILIYGSIKFKKINYVIGAFASIIILQMILFLEKWEHSKINQLWLLYQHEKTLIVHHTPNKLFLYSPQDISGEERVINDFKNEYPIDEVEIKTFKNTFVRNETELLVLDERVIYKIPNIQPTHLLLSNDPKVNLDRVLANIQPTMVIADGSNPPWSINRWRKKL
jgi:competence protein ComEC